MKYTKKLDNIIEFVVTHPETVASRTILRRNLLNLEEYETSRELSSDLKSVLKKLNEEEIDVYYNLVK